jgi:hypothetical protein
VHSALRVANQPSPAQLSTIPDFAFSGLSMFGLRLHLRVKQSLEQPNAPREHQRPKQESKNTRQKFHGLKAPSREYAL